MLSEEQKQTQLEQLQITDRQIMSELKDFQRKTVERIDTLFRQGQDRVLVADEVGLGKTMIAKGVLSKLAILRHQEGDDLVRVTYICSNQTIAKQNLIKLKIGDARIDDISDTRLSMQHLKVTQQEVFATHNNQYVQLIPLTPNTSFQTTGTARGTVRERALMFVILAGMDGIDAKALEKVMSYGALRAWPYWLDKYRTAVNECHNEKEEYPDNIRQQIKEYDAFRQLQEYLDGKSTIEEKKVIADLRQMFALISVGMLNPDLVIMDEFQRFQFMINHAQGETGILVRKFMRSQSDKIEDKVRVLLLSATPYKLYNTLEEVGDANNNESYQEFLSVMHFLQEGHNTSFDSMWGRYSKCLKELKEDKQSLRNLAIETHKVEDALYQNMCRTERLSVMDNGDFVDDSSKDKALAISESDIKSYKAARRVVEAIGGGRQLPIDYVKSCPYLLSFMQNYELKRHIVEYYKRHPNEVDNCYSDMLWMKQRPGYKKLPVTNARLERLMQELFASKGNELLLWVPPSMPYYESEGVFKDKQNFSKIIAFSSWEMVPRMISCLVSYEVERRIVNEKKKLPSPRLKKGIPTTDILYTYYPELAECYDPSFYVRERITHLRDIEKGVREKITSKLDKIRSVHGLEDVEVSTLVNLAIASPANCFYRIFKNVQLAERLAQAFIRYLNTSEKTAIIELATESKRQAQAHWQDVLTYCKQGNLQATLDEYVHYLTNGDSKKLNEDLADTIQTALELRTTNYTIDTFPRFKSRVQKMQSSDKEVTMRSHYATAFAQGTGEKGQDRKENLQCSFNSPFWPFVLASTSIGQEGLDFHPYCRKIMHWNLPSNPIDLEQREGRINRYKCLAIRQNIALTYGERVKSQWVGDDIWNHLFEAAVAEKQEGQSELIPFWCLGKNQRIKIERIIANYPVSIDEERYKRLIQVLSLYRLTMGQARQSELLEYVFDNFNHPEELRHFFINLSPFEKEKS